MRKIIVYIATSADGYIARPDGDIAWLDRPIPKGNYGMGAFYESIDTVLLGRKTYETALQLGQQSYPGKRNYVFSRSLKPTDGSDVMVTSVSVREFIRKTRRAKGKNIWLVGGAELIAAFLDENGIDEFMIHVVPVFIGEGIPLIAPRHRLIELDLLGSKVYSDGIVLLHYSMAKPARRKRGQES